MNLILFKPGEWENPIPRKDPRNVHIRKILKASAGDTLTAGIVNGAMGTALLEEITSDGAMRFAFTPRTDPAPLSPVTMIIGIPRPPTARRLLKDLTTAGIRRIIFTGTDLGEKSYLTSRLWTREEYRDAVLEGASQGKTTLLPEVVKLYSLYKAIGLLDDRTDRLALDNVEPEIPLKDYIPSKDETCLAIGPERGWSDREREMLREGGFSVCSLGDRVLRTETASHMGCALVQAARGYI